MNIWKSIIAGIGIVLAIFIVGLVGRWESTYERTALVESVNDGIVTFEDSSGNLWNYESNEYVLGENVILVLRNAETSRVQDDVILEVKLIEE